MNRARLTFTKAKNSFSVKIDNLEKLSVQKIQELENFVKIRNGIFDFNSYKFVIQKRLEFGEFVSLLKECDIEAICKENIIVEKSKPRVGFGQYKGMLYSELPDSYMLWLKTNYRGYDRDKIDLEIKRRKL